MSKIHAAKAPIATHYFFFRISTPDINEKIIKPTIIIRRTKGERKIISQTMAIAIAGRKIFSNIILNVLFSPLSLLLVINRLILIHPYMVRSSLEPLYKFNTSLSNTHFPLNLIK